MFCYESDEKIKRLLYKCAVELSYGIKGFVYSETLFLHGVQILVTPCEWPFHNTDFKDWNWKPLFILMKWTKLGLLQFVCPNFHLK